MLAATPAPPLPAALPAPPARLTRAGQLSSSDRVLSIRADDGFVVESLLQHLEDLLSGSQKAQAREQLATALSLRALQPWLSQMTRGDSKSVSLTLGGRPGELEVTARVVRAVTTGTYQKLEFEDGSDSYASVGYVREGRSRVGGGLTLKGATARQTTLSGQLGISRDKTTSRIVVSNGRMFSRGKTVEPALRIDAEIQLDFAFSPAPGEGLLQSLWRGAAASAGAASAFRFQVLLPVLVAAPAAEAADAPGRTSEQQHYYRPPLRVEQTRSLGGTDIVKDVYAVDAKGHRTGGGMRTLIGDADNPASLESFGHGQFGGDWPAVRAELLSRVDLTALHAGLKTMMSGEPFEVLLSKGRGSILVAAQVEEMAHLRTTEQTEFNTGRDVTRTITSLGAHTWSAQATPLSGQNSHLGFDPGPHVRESFAFSRSVAGQYGRDRMSLDRVSLRAVNAVKMKVPGVIFDGVATLTFSYLADPATVTDAPKAARATARLGFQVLSEAAESQAVDSAQSFVAVTRVPGPLAMEAPIVPEGATAWRPKPQVWGLEPGAKQGLPESAVILDVFVGPQLLEGRPPSRSLGSLVNELGRTFFGPRAWSTTRPAVRSALSRESLAAWLPEMIRNVPAQSPPLTRLGHADAQMSATAQLERLEFLRILEKAELNVINEVASGSGNQLASWSAFTEKGQFGSPVAFGKGDSLGLSFGGGHVIRQRNGSRAAEGASTIAGAKFAEPMVVFVGTAQVDVRFAEQGSEDPGVTGRTQVRFMVGLPKSHAEQYVVEGGAAGRQTVTRAEAHRVSGSAGPTGSGAPVGVPVAGTAPAADTPPPDMPPPDMPPPDTPPPALAYQPPERVSRYGQLGASDVVLGLDDGMVVMKALREALGVTFRGHVSHIEADLLPFFDSIALRSLVSALTSGEDWGTSVTVNGTRADIRIVSANARMTQYLRYVKDFEVESGTESSAFIGETEDRLNRRIGTAGVAAKLPHVSLGLDHTRNSDSVVGHTHDNRAGVASKRKTVEPMALFKGALEFTVQIELVHPLGIPGGTRTLLAATEGEFAFPVREMPVDPATEAKPKPATYHSPPPRIARSLVLGASDIVLNVLAPEGDRFSAATVLDQLDAAGTHVLGSSRAWAAARRTLERKIVAGRLQMRMKSLMAGQPWVIALKGGSVTITAGVRELTYLAEAGTTEFASGATIGALSGGTDGLTAYTQGESGVTSLQALGTSNPLGHGPAVVAGGTFTLTRGHDEVEVRSSGSQTGQGIKAKVPGSVFDGVALLHFEFRRSWRLRGRTVDQRTSGDARARQRTLDQLRRQIAELSGQPGTETEVTELRARYDAEVAEQSERIRTNARAKAAAVDGGATPGMTRTAFGVREHGFGYAEVRFQALVETADTSPVAQVTDARVRAGQPAGTTRPAHEPRTLHVPPAEIWDKGLAASHMIRDLPDVRSLRGLLNAAGRRIYRGAWDARLTGGHRRSALVMDSFNRDRLWANLPRLTAGEHLRSAPFWVNGRQAWVTVTAKVLDLAYDREELKAETALVGETSSWFSERRLNSLDVQFMLQAGVELPTLGKFSPVLGLGGGYGRRYGGERATGGRVIAQSKIPDPVVYFDGHVEFRFTFHHGTGAKAEGAAEQVSGVVPFAVAIPQEEIRQQVTGTEATFFTGADPLGTQWPPAARPRRVVPGGGARS